MMKRTAYVAVVALFVGALLTGAVGSAWSMDVLTDEQLSSIRGMDDCGDREDCTDGGGCTLSHFCNQDWDTCSGYETLTNITWDQKTSGVGTVTIVERLVCKDCDCQPAFYHKCKVNKESCGAPYQEEDHCVETS